METGGTTRICKSKYCRYKRDDERGRGLVLAICYRTDGGSSKFTLEQILQATSTRYILTPNQYVGAYHVGFMPQWITREYLARRGSARFKMEQLVPSRCELLGYSLESVKVDGTKLSRGLIQTNYQPEVGNDTYDEGARNLKEFFKKELKKYLTDDLNPVGRQIIECCLDDGTLDDYLGFIPMRY